MSLLSPPAVMWLAFWTGVLLAELVIWLKWEIPRWRNDRRVREANRLYRSEDHSHEVRTGGLSGADLRGANLSGADLRPR